MTRKRNIVLMGIALIVLLALTDRATSSAELVPANVVSVMELDADAGPDMWEITFKLADGKQYAAEPMNVRLTFSEGDPICIRKRTRSWTQPTYQFTAEQSCRGGAPASLRAPD